MLTYALAYAGELVKLRRMLTFALTYAGRMLTYALTYAGELVKLRRERREADDIYDTFQVLTTRRSQTSPLSLLFTTADVC